MTSCLEAAGAHDVAPVHRWAENLNALSSGQAGDLRIRQGLLLGAAVLMTIPMAAVLACRIAPHRVARWSSVGAGTVMTVAQAASLAVGTGPKLHYLYYSVIEIVTTAVIVWYAAARWRTDACSTHLLGTSVSHHPWGDVVQPFRLDWIKCSGFQVACR